MAARIDLADIQGDILRAYGNRYDRTSYVFVGVGDPAAGRTWLQGIYDRVTSAVEWTGPRPETTLNVAFTRAGLTALGVAPRVVDSFSHEFRQGMAGRCQELGDVAESEPARWNEGLGTDEAHVLVTINAQDDHGRDAALDELRSGLRAAGSLSVVHEEHAQMLDGRREHFGFADGFAQPSIEGVNEDRVLGGGVPETRGRWRPLAPGEFILGYEDEESRVDRKRRLPSAPAGALGRSGTYMVWRKLYQDVALFRRTLRDAARTYEHGDEDALAAKIVGRWQNGTPLVVSPDAEQPGFDPKHPHANDFRYADVDLDGRRCPLGAHIRRSNPRDALGSGSFAGKLSFRHRMIRRGMPYGPLLDAGAVEHDAEDRGLVFVCFNASISRQFESVQRQWLNDGNVFHLAHDSDFLLGGSTEAMGKMTVHGDPPFFFSPMGPFVTTRGGEYLFVPGMTGLAAVADGVTG
jgi:Dyp-type peroxidase family